MNEMQKVSMMLDTACTMAIYSMAKICSEDEIKAYFMVNRDRLIAQNFTEEEIDEFQNVIKDGMLQVKK
jgi:hypothetical protein